MEIKELLKKAGFSEKETDVYLALCAGGPSVASDVAKQARINRSTTYIILEALTKRNLVEATGEGVRLFTPREPEALIEYLTRASDHFDALAKQARKLLPSLKKGAKLDTGSEVDSAYGAALASLEQIRTKSPEKPARNKAIKSAPNIA